MTCFVEEHDITKGGWSVASATTLSTEPYSTVAEVTLVFNKIPQQNKLCLLLDREGKRHLEGQMASVETQIFDLEECGPK